MKKIISLIAAVAVVFSIGMTALASPAVDKTPQPEPEPEKIAATIVGHSDVLVSVEEYGSEALHSETIAKLAEKVKDGQAARVFDITVGNSVKVENGRLVVEQMGATKLARISGGYFEVSLTFDQAKVVKAIYVLDNGKWEKLPNTNWRIQNGKVIFRTADNGLFAFVYTSTNTESQKLSIKTQPVSYSGPVGTTAKFTVIAQGVGLKYQWQTYKNGKWVNSSLSGYNTATLSVPVTQARNGYKFRCIVTDSRNNSVTSNAVTLKVTAPASLAITTQPKNYKGPVGSTATFKVVATGTGLTYQWQTYKNGKWVNSSLNGAKTNVLSVPVTRARNGYKFRCVVTDASGKKVTSSTATLSVG